MGYYELYQQALEAIDAQGIPNWSKDYYPAVRKRHKELVDEHIQVSGIPDDLPIWNGYDWDGDADLSREDRETRIASGVESYAPGDNV